MVRQVEPMGPDSRAQALDALRGQTFDVLIVGGGITGAGCALDAASRGLRVAMIEREDFASGTSSKSSKLVHGGLRYLAQYDFGLTWEAAHERDLLIRLAPHLVRPLPFLYPVFRKGRESRFASVGLHIYDALSAARGVKRHRRADRATVRDLAPGIDVDRVVGAWTYWDASTDDARLVFELVRTAHAFGAVAANWVRVDGFAVNARSIVSAASVTDTITGDTFEVRARVIVNATGVWAEQVGRLDASTTGSALALRPAKGIHLAVPADRLPSASGCIIPSPERDRRALFTIPWGGRVVIGTTDTAYSGSLDAPSVEQSDVDYVLAGVNKWLGADLSASDVVAAWAGLRPLRALHDRDGEASKFGRTTDLSRRHAITVSRSGLVSITGGKLTTYRRMALDAIDAACEQLGERRRSCTRRVRIGLSRSVRMVEHDVAELLRSAALDPGMAPRLVASYGDAASGVAGLAVTDQTLAKPVGVDTPVIGAEVVWAVRHEMAVTLSDALARRTRLSLTDASAGLGGDAPALVAKHAGWSDEDLALQARMYAAQIATERGPIRLRTPTVEPSGTGTFVRDDP